ncbi:AI-2E family transporter [Rathayibacter sp. YIM 133350]|uniref:AI-2E family transporter n=1 Tax=Rathayibacter sp. YIM 133350 TaxID=3131992 RepID=UPI00307E0120
MWFRRKGAAEPSTAPASGDDTPRETSRDADPHRAAFILMGLGGAAVSAFGLAAIQSIFAPTFLALVLTICVHPLRTTLIKRGVPRGLATGSVILTVVLLLAAFGWALFVAFAQFTTLLPHYGPQLQAALESFGDWLASLGIGQAQVEAIISGFDPSRLVALAGGLLGSAAGVTTGLVIVLTMLILMAADAGFGPTLLHQLEPRRPALVSALVEFAHGVRSYMVVTTALGVAQGVINGVALALLGIPGAALWGMLAFLCSFIPNIGYFIAIIPPLVFGALVGGWPLVVAVVVIYGIINAVIQSIIQPKVVGNAVALSQTLTFFSVLFWAVVAGPVGAILAIPLSLLVRMLLVDSNPRARWLRPALGDLTSTKALLDAETADAKGARRAAKAAKADGRR